MDKVKTVRFGHFFSLSLLLREMISHIKRVLALILISSIIIIFFIILYPIISTGTIDLNGGVFSMLPPEIKDIIKLDWLLPYQKYVTFLSLGLQFIVMIICIFSTIIGCKSIVRERTFATREYLFSLPITRTGIAISKFIANILTIIVMNLFIFILVGLFTSLFVKNSGNYNTTVLRMLSYSLIPEITFMSIGFFASSIIKDISLSSSIGLSTFLITFILGFVGSYFEKVSFLKYYSPYHLCDPLLSVHNGFVMDIGHIWVNIAVILICVTLTILGYSRQDITN